MRDNMMMVTTAQLPNYAETLENKGIQYLPKKQLKLVNSKDFTYNYSKEQYCK